MDTPHSGHAVCSITTGHTAFPAAILADYYLANA